MENCLVRNWAVFVLSEGYLAGILEKMVLALKFKPYEL